MLYAEFFNFRCFVAFAHGKRKGLLYEQTFNYGYNISHAAITMDTNLHPNTFVDSEFKHIKEKLSALNEIGFTKIHDRQNNITNNMKELGLER